MARLYAILDEAWCPCDRWLATAESLIAGGVGLLQLRAKRLPPEKIGHWACQIHPLTRAAGVPLIINDYPELLNQCPAEGCHLGQDDLPLAQARALIQRPVLLGKSTHSLEQAIAAEKEGADYIGVGPIFPTQTKPDYSPVTPALITKVAAKVRLPQFCIGGIRLENLAEVIMAGANRVVIVSALLTAPDPTEMARRVLDRLAPLSSD